MDRDRVMNDAKIPHHADVVIVGAGAAGLYAALCIPSHYSVCLLTKEKLRVGASDWAQGGIAAAIAPTDSVMAHFEDTLKAGAGLCDREAVEFLVANAPDAIEQLVRFGVAFDRHGDQLALTTEAAHSHPRVLHAADTTGRAIVSILTERVLERPNIQVIPHASALKISTDAQTETCQGLWVWQGQHTYWLGAGAVILATGGGGQVYAHTTNPALSTGDGVALAWRAGAQVRDLEFVQFHPTALMVQDAPCFLISEAVRGEGAHLIDDQGDRFTLNYHPQGELAPRDVVSRAIFQHLSQSDQSSNCVYLDLSPIPPERIQYRFPNIIQMCKRWGIDVFSQPIPVAPAAHYWMGGITTDVQNQTSIPGLYAIGEVTNTGVHGANRLASNSLLECIVFASQFANLELPTSSPAAPTVHSTQTVTIATPSAQLQQYQQQSQQLMWQAAGICRDEMALQTAIVQLSTINSALSQEPFLQAVQQLDVEQALVLDSAQTEAIVREVLEVENLLAVSQLILKSALFRTESRGGHYRSDYPQTLEEWAVHTIVAGDHVRRNTKKP